MALVVAAKMIPLPEPYFSLMGWSLIISFFGTIDYPIFNNKRKACLRGVSEEEDMNKLQRR